MVEHTPQNQEVAGPNPARFWAFSVFLRDLQLSVLTLAPQQNPLWRGQRQTNWAIGFSGKNRESQASLFNLFEQLKAYMKIQIRHNLEFYNPGIRKLNYSVTDELSFLSFRFFCIWGSSSIKYLDLIWRQIPSKHYLEDRFPLNQGMLLLPKGKTYFRLVLVVSQGDTYLKTDTSMKYLNLEWCGVARIWHIAHVITCSINIWTNASSNLRFISQPVSNPSRAECCLTSVF